MLPVTVFRRIPFGTFEGDYIAGDNDGQIYILTAEMKRDAGIDLFSQDFSSIDMVFLGSGVTVKPLDCVGNDQWKGDTQRQIGFQDIQSYKNNFPVWRLINYDQRILKRADDYLSFIWWLHLICFTYLDICQVGKFQDRMLP